MGLFTSGTHNVAILKLKTSSELQAVHSALNSLTYPANPDHQTEGFGSFSDGDDHARREPLTQDFTGRPPELVLGRQHDVQHIQARFYYDDVNFTLKKRFGVVSDWRLFHVRRGFDLMILDEGEDDLFTVLVCTRNNTELKYARKNLEAAVQGIDAASSLRGASLNEELDPDFFLWLLFKIKDDSNVGSELQLKDVREIDSIDSHGGKAWLTSGATTDRVELLALIAKGQMRLGPAKIGVKFTGDPAGYFDIQLFHDGGFAVFRTSEYDDQDDNPVPADQFGIRLALDVWCLLLPALRQAFADDADWRSTRRDEFVAGVKDELKTITGGHL